MQNNKKSTTVAVIGMGVAGISSLYGLYNGIKDLPIETDIKLDIFNDGYIGGMQYTNGPTSLEHWINMELDAMSVANINPLEWIHKHKDKIKDFIISNFPKHELLANTLKIIDDIKPDSTNIYIPRIVYGLYLKSIYSTVIKDLETLGVKIEQHNERIKDIIPNSFNNYNEKIYDYVLYSGGHQLSEIQNEFTKKVNSYPVSYLEKRLDAILEAKLKTGIKPISIDIKILGTSLSGIDVVFSINHWLEELKQKNIEVYKDVKINMVISSRSLLFPTSRVTTMPENPINNDAMLELCKTMYYNIQHKSPHLNKSEFEQEVINLYCNIINLYRRKLAKNEHCDTIKDLTLNDIFTGHKQRCENINDLRKNINKNIELSQSGDKEYLINQACFRMSSKCGAFLFGKLAEHGLGSSYRTQYLNNVAPVPHQTLTRFLGVLNHEKVNTNIISALSSLEKEQDYDTTIDATNNVKVVQNHKEPIYTMLECGIIQTNGQSNDSKLITSGNNKIETAIVDRSAIEGENAGANLALKLSIPSLLSNNNSTLWHLESSCSKLNRYSLNTGFTAISKEQQQTTNKERVLHYHSEIKPRL